MLVSKEINNGNYSTTLITYNDLSTNINNDLLDPERIAAIEAIKQNIDYINELKTLNTNIQNIENNINTLSTNIDNIGLNSLTENECTSIYNCITEYIDTLTGDVDERVDTLRTTCDTLTNKINNTIEPNINTLNGSITDIQDKLDYLLNDLNLDNIKTNIDNIKTHLYGTSETPGENSLKVYDIYDKLYQIYDFLTLETVEDEDVTIEEDENVTIDKFLEDIITEKIQEIQDNYDSQFKNMQTLQASSNNIQLTANESNIVTIRLAAITDYTPVYITSINNTNNNIIITGANIILNGSSYNANINIKNITGNNVNTNITINILYMKLS